MEEIRDTHTHTEMHLVLYSGTFMCERTHFAQSHEIKNLSVSLRNKINSSIIHSESSRVMKHVMTRCPKCYIALYSRCRKKSLVFAAKYCEGNSGDDRNKMNVCDISMCARTSSFFFFGKETAI